MSRNKKGARRRVYTPLSLDELARITGLDPRQKLLIRRYFLSKGYRERG